jgi:transitional endoplasmic reticulum ATPase
MGRGRRYTAVGFLELTEERLDSILGDYVHNLLIGTRFRLLQKRDVMHLEDQLIIQEMARAGTPENPCFADLEDEQKQLVRALRRQMRRSHRPRAPRAMPAPAGANLQVLAKLLGLTDAEQAVLTFLVCVHLDTELRTITELLGDGCLTVHARTVAIATGQPVEQSLAAVSTGSRLVESGLLTGEANASYTTSLPNRLELRPGLVDLVLAPRLDRRTVLRRFLPAAKKPTLTREDFAHLAGPVSLLLGLLGAALRRHTPGMNVLLYGPTGTGKTELARLVAQELGTELFVAGMTDAEGQSAAPNERLASLLLGHRIIGSAPALLLFDEVEDLFRWEARGMFALAARTSAYMSKQWFNTMLESNPVPTIWISNVVDGIDEAFLRRFSYAIELKALGVAQRARVLGRHLGTGSALGPEDVEAIAQQHQVSPAQLASAVAGARLLAEDGQPDRSTIEHLLAPIEKLVTGKDPSRRSVFDPRAYCIDALNSPDDLAGIADRLAGWKPGAGPGISLCLYGPPGTGKSEYVRYLAHRMGRRVVARRGSDLLSMWVGGTEKLIAAAFAEAEEDDAVLLLDEVDTFLRDRRHATHSWEVSETNELLQQLERFRGVVACTTNLWRELDQASLRRFVFKVELRFMKPEQAATLFRTAFADLLYEPLTDVELAMVRATVTATNRLTPGDFAAVGRRVRALGEPALVAELCALLLGEVEAKGAAPRRVGF